jgi:hypothetical protein
MPSAATASARPSIPTTPSASGDAGEAGADELVPVGKAYFGFTDEELIEIDRFVRKNTTNRFGPVREVVHTLTKRPGASRVAFEGLQRSTRHKSGRSRCAFPASSAFAGTSQPGRGRPDRDAGGAAACKLAILCGSLRLEH